MLEDAPLQAFRGVRANCGEVRREFLIIEPQLKDMSYRVGTLRTFPDYRAIDVGEGVKGLWIDPIPSTLITNEISSFASAAGIHPVRIPGYWLDKKGLDIAIGEAPAPGEKVVYCLHGGGYIAHSASTQSDYREYIRGILKYSHPARRLFSIEYRLSTERPYVPSNHFPAALYDALAGYVYLIDVVGYNPADIIVVGDSAGGNLALALTPLLPCRKPNFRLDTFEVPCAARCNASPLTLVRP